MNNKIVKLIAFCMAVTLMIFSPAICSLGFNVYLDISMKSTGSLPTVKTQAKLEKLLDNRNDRVYINTTIKNSSTRLELDDFTTSSSSNPFDILPIDVISQLSAVNLANKS